MDGTIEWDPVMMEEYLAAASQEIANDHLLEARRRILGIQHVTLDLRRYGVSVDIRPPLISQR